MSDFEILSQLGKGSFGFVYKVRRKTDNTTYALKKVSFSKLSLKEKENSLNEIRILASLHNKHVIAYKDAFYDNDSNCLCLVMEFAEFGDLEKLIHQRIKTKNFFTEYEILSIFIQITKGIKNLHDNNIMHRDIKSANIFMFKNDIVKIGDMNVSKILKNGLKHTQTGTPFYASPEVWDNQQYDIKCDIWSLGCLLYEITTLRPPFRGTTMKMVYEKVKGGLYEPIPKFYSKSLAGLIFICLQSWPQNRPTCGQLLDLINSKINTFNLEGKCLQVYDKDEDKNDNQRRPNGLEIKNNDFDVYFGNEEEYNNLLSTIKIPNKMDDINSLLPKNRYVKNVNSKQNSNGSHKKLKKPLLKICGNKLPKLNVNEYKHHKLNEIKKESINIKNKTLEHSQSNKKINIKHHYNEINMSVNHKPKDKSVPKLDNRYNNNNYIGNNLTILENESKDEITNRMTSSNGNIHNRSIKTPSPQPSLKSIQTSSIQTPIPEPSPVRLINQECPYFKKRTITPESNNHHNKGFAPRSYSQNRMKLKCDAKILLNPLRKIKSIKDFDHNCDRNEESGLSLGVPLFNKRKHLKTIEPNMKRILNRPINIHRKQLKSENYNNVNINNRKINTEKAIRSKQESINELREDISKINEMIKNISSNDLHDTPLYYSNNRTIIKDSPITEQNINNIIHQQPQIKFEKIKFKINKQLHNQNRAISAYLPRNLSSVTPSNNKIISDLPHQLSTDPVTPLMNVNQINYHQYSNIPQKHINLFSNNKLDIGNEFKKRIGRHKHKQFRSSILTNDSDISKSGLPTIEKTDINPTSPNSIKLNRNLSYINNLRSLSKEKEQQIKIPKMIQFSMKNYNDNSSLFSHYKRNNPIKVMPMLHKGNSNNVEYIDNLSFIEKKKHKYKINQSKYKENLSEIDRMVMNMQVPKFGS